MFHDCGGYGHFHLYLLSDPSQVWLSYGPTPLSGCPAIRETRPILAINTFHVHFVTVTP